MDYIQNEDYCFVEINNTTGVKILTGEFSGVLFTYANVHFQESETGSDLPAVLKYDYTVYDKGESSDEELLEYTFKQKIGDILMSILEYVTAED